MKKNLIMLLILSMLAMQFPTVIASAADGTDEREAITFAMRSTVAASPNVAKVYNNSLSAARAKGMGSFAGKQIAWTDINYTSVEEGKEWVGFSEELKNSGSKDLSGIKDYSKVVYTLTAADTVDLSNLYLTVHSSNGAIAGISADEYFTADKDGNGTPDVQDGYTTVTVDLSRFTADGAVNFVEGQTFDASKFSGMGIVRKDADPKPTSSGRISFSKMSVVSIPAVTDLAAEIRSGIQLSFTKPSIGTIDKYEIVRTNGANSTTFELADDDFTLENGKYVYVDTTPEVEIEYSYKLRIHESEYDMYSPFSNAVTAEISEDDGGDELPTDGASTIVWNPNVRDFSWSGDRSAYSNPDTNGGGGQANANAASIPGMGAGQILRYDLNPANFKEYSRYEEPGTWQIKVYRGYMTAGIAYAEAKGGDNGNQNTSYNINNIKDTGYAIFTIKIDEAVPLDNLYFMMGDSASDGSHADSRNYVAVPVTDYITDADKGSTTTVAIPLKDFTLANPHMFQNMRNNEWASANTPDVVQELNWKAVRIMGFMRRVRNGNNNESDPLFETPSYTSGYIYCGNSFVTNIAPETDFRIYDVKEDKIILKWTHTADKAVKYNVYRTDGDGERRFIGETTKNQYVDYYEDGKFPAGVKFKYEVEAVDEYGTRSPMQSDETTIRTIDHPRKVQAASQESATTELAVDVSWQAPLFGELKEYRLYRNGSLYRTFGADETSFRDTEFVEHNDYTYTMTAVDTNNLESLATNPVTVTASALGKPSNLGYEVKNLNQVELSYASPNFAEKYYIYLNGEKIAETNDVTYTVENVSYDTALVFGVRAVNAAGATSNETQTEQFVIKNPKMNTSAVIYDDALDSSLSRAPMAGLEMGETTAKSIIGKKSMKFDFSTRKANTLTGAFSGKIDIKNYRDNGGHLGFWLWADNNADLSKFEVGVGMGGSVAGTTTTMYSTVKASDYVSALEKWVYVDIPLKDLPDACSGTANGLSQSQAMDYAKATQYSFRYNNSQQETGPIFYIDQMTIDTGAAWSISRIQDDKGTASPSMSAGAKSLMLQFSEDMDAKTLTSNGVTLSYADGEETKYVGFYGAYDNNTKLYTLNFLEPLKQNTQYTLNISGAASAEGMTGTYNTTLTTNADTPATIDYAVPAITTVMSSTSSGSTTTVTVAMPSDRNETVNNYTIKLSYNPTYVALNGAKAVTDTPDGATVKTESGSVTISGTKDGNTLTGTLMTVKFSTVNAGTANLTVSGRCEVYNAQADASAVANVNGTYSFTAKKNTQQGSTSGGKDGTTSNNPAGRENGVKPNDWAPSPDTKPDTNTGNADNFTDISDVPWAKDAILYLAQKGYINGFDDGTYRPNDTITREQFAKIIVNVLGYDSYQYDPAEFTDMDKNAWYAKFVTIAAKSGLINGIDDNNFGTGMDITRQDMCTIIYRAIKTDNIKMSEIYSDIQFSDTASDYAQEAIRELYRWGLVSGVGDNKFDPFGSVTRAMAAKVLYQLSLKL